MTSPTPVTEVPSEGRGPVAVIWLSVAAAIVTIALKGVAFMLTDSVGLLSDAMESLVNLAGAVFALRMLSLARTPPDAGHPFGHGKAEYFSSGFEGLLILIAAVAMGIAATGRLLEPHELTSLDIGLALSIVATLINLAVARILLRAARRYRSTALEADARHLMTDVWTTVGLVIGLLLVSWFDAAWIDPVLALLVAANIAREGVLIIRQAANGLLDSALDKESLGKITAALATFEGPEVRVTKTQSRQAGHQAFVHVVVEVPGHWTVTRAHDLSDAIEAALEEAVPGLVGMIHVEPSESLVPSPHP